MMITRRGFAFGIGAAGLLAGLDPAYAASNREITAREITAWIVIKEDDTTIIRVARSEMGQGSFTALPMLVAEELECDWNRVQPEYASPSENLARGRPWGDMVTAASLSIRASHLYLRKAGAQARIMLVTEAASRFGVPPGECTARGSVVTHAATGRSLRYGELAEAASQRAVPRLRSAQAPGRLAADRPIRPPLRRGRQGDGPGDLRQRCAPPRDAACRNRRLPGAGRQARAL